MRHVKPHNGWGWIVSLIILGLGAAVFHITVLPSGSVSQVITEAFRLGWIGGLFILGLILWIQIGKFPFSIRQRWTVKGPVALLAYCLFFFSIANYKVHFVEKTGLLPISLLLLAAVTFLLAVYFGKAQTLLRVGGTMILLTAVMSGFGNWLPQVEGGFPTPEIPFNMYTMTPQQLADEGEKIIFGGIGQSKVQGAVGRGQCPLCHEFMQGYRSERAPNLWGITARKRLHGTPIEYIAESHICPDCYIVAGWNCHFLNDTTPHSYMPRIHRPPISLSIEELIAVDTWFFVREGEIPPSPETIEAAYQKFAPEGGYVQKETPFNPHDEEYPEDNLPKVLVTGEETIEKIFVKTKCTNCHMIPGIKWARKTVAPNLKMETSGQTRLGDPTYRGKATTVREYIKESILAPNVYVVSGFSSNKMPSDYGTKISALALDKMVNYLADVEEEKNE